MTARTVTTQDELDAALTADDVDLIRITSPAGVWLTISSAGSATVEAFGSATVRASGAATVRAFDSATVWASGSATVRAFDSATVWAFGSATVRAGKYVAVHLHSARATVDGGVVIDIASLDQKDPTVWCDLQGIPVRDGRAVVYKAVDDQLRSLRGHAYPIGATVVAEDWRNDGDCGGGLHFGPTPRHAREYHSEATRFLACSIPVDAACGIPGGTAKVKARECVVLHEVDLDGQRLAVEAVAS